MGRYDDITDAQLRSEVARFARILQRMEERGETLDRTADILNLLAELRIMVFAWEIRATWGEEGPGGVEQPGEAEARSVAERIVREAREAQERLRRRLEEDGG
jgi:hypothetical protein